MQIKLQNEAMEDKLSELNDKFTELRNRMSELRKHGKDTEIAEIKFLDVIPLFKMARATYEKDEIEAIELLYDGLKAEIDLSERGTDFSMFS
jgi:predicted nuclease with TOPRIM domain